VITDSDQRPAPRPPISLTDLQTADEQVHVSPGESISGAARQAIREAKRLHAPVKFEFNGELVICSATDRPEDIEGLCCLNRVGVG
jgi:hypothetical protein